ncbi:Uncharacterised protein [Neisseria animalis]|nr:Uncharacterised protein [Neisseria animalis]
MIQRCFALPYYVYCLRLRFLVSFLFYSTIENHTLRPLQKNRKQTKTDGRGGFYTPEN